jgi:hypothetical protein
MSHKHGQRWENVVGKELKRWATRIMGEGYTRAEARQMILKDIQEKLHPPGDICIRIKRFVRVPFWHGWTIGYDWKNGAILQFTKTVPYDHKYRNVGLFVFRYVYNSLTWEAKEGRHFVNIGWNV